MSEQTEMLKKQNVEMPNEDIEKILTDKDLRIKVQTQLRKIISHITLDTSNKMFTIHYHSNTDKTSYVIAKDYKSWKKC